VKAAVTKKILGTDWEWQFPLLTMSDNCLGNFKVHLITPKKQTWLARLAFAAVEYTETTRCVLRDFNLQLKLGREWKDVGSLRMQTLRDMPYIVESHVGDRKQVSRVTAWDCERPRVIVDLQSWIVMESDAEVAVTSVAADILFIAILEFLNRLALCKNQQLKNPFINRPLVTFSVSNLSFGMNLATSNAANEFFRSKELYNDDLTEEVKIPRDLSPFKSFEDSEGGSYNVTFEKVT